MYGDNKDYKHNQGKDVDSDEYDPFEELKMKKSKAGAVDKKHKAAVYSFDRDQTEFELSKRRRVCVRPFTSGEPSVDIREKYMDTDTNQMKFGKGICLPLAQWEELKKLMPEIDAAIEKLKQK